MSQNIKNQSGAVLVVSLVLLLVMTLMGITSMSVTTSELQIASNQQAHNNSYEAALSVLETTKRSDTVVWNNIVRANTQSVSASGTGFTGSAVITYEHCIRGAIGNSLTVESQSGDSSSNFGRVVQEIVATGYAMSNGQQTATTTMVNGVSVKVAQCP